MTVMWQLVAPMCTSQFQTAITSQIIRYKPRATASRSQLRHHNEGRRTTSGSGKLYIFSPQPFQYLRDFAIIAAVSTKLKVNFGRKVPRQRFF